MNFAMKNRLRLTTVMLWLAVAGVAPLDAQATGPSSVNALGTFNGSGTDQCTSPLESPESFEIQVTINQQNANAFSGSATLLFADGVEDFASLQGLVDGAGNITGGTFSSADGNGTFSGSLTGDKLSINYLGSGLSCAAFNGSFTAVRGALGAQTSGNLATGEATVREGTRQFISAIDTRQASVRNALLGRATSDSGLSRLANGLLYESPAGAAAGDEYQSPWGLWGAVQYSGFEDDFAATAFEADKFGAYGGIDVSPWDNMVFGVALAYDRTDVETSFNRGEQEIEGITVAPYLGLLVPDFGLDWDMTIDLSVGYGSLNIDQFRTAAGTRITSDVDADRYFFTGNLNGTRSFGNWLANLRVGLIAARDEHGAFTESDGTSVAAKRFALGQVRAGGDLSYVAGSFEPFLSAIYAYDYEREDLVVAGARQPANDADDVTLGLGVRWFSQESMSAALEYNTVLGREDFDSHTVQFLIRKQF